jgi:hypothetical protein
VDEAIDDVFLASDGRITSAAPGVLGNDHVVTAGAAVILADTVQHGTLELDPDGAFRYTPDPDFTGTDSFTYQLVVDGWAVDTATVTLDVRATAGVAEVFDVPGSVDGEIGMNFGAIDLLSFSFDWLVPGIALAVPGLLLILALGAQLLAVGFWLPMIRRFRRGQGWRAQPA